jgi:hypothetical protein
MPAIVMSLLFVLFGCASMLSAAGRANLLYIETN